MLILRAAHLQLLPDSRLKDLKIRQYKALIELPARRGLIVDRNDKELAVTVPAWSIYADPKEIESPKKVSKWLAKKLGMSPHFVYEKIKNKEKRFVWLKRRLKKEFIQGLEKNKIRGIGFVEESERVYPNEKFLSHVLGFVGGEGQGLEGMELKFDEILKGESRKIKVERDARGRPLLVDGRLFSDIPAGYDIKLTIDSELQFHLEQELAKSVSTTDADSASGIILNPMTGEILAMANSPTYDPNWPQAMSAEVRRNKVVTDAFEPGSTIKTLIIAGAIEKGVIKPNSKFNCENGKFKIDDKFIREADSSHNFGTLTATEVLALSSNIGTSKIALEMKSDLVRQSLLNFGLGQKTGISLPGEAQGIVQELPWRKHLLANISFGHGLTATPLQISMAYAAIANGGILREPMLVKSARHQETDELIEFRSKELRRVLSVENAATLRLMLNAATAYKSTGYNARIRGFPVAGKTGTAQKIIVGEGYAKDKYISSFVGFVPANDPKFVIFVGIDNPKQKYYGSEVAAPVFSRLANHAVMRSGLSPVLLGPKSLVKHKVKPADEHKQTASLHRIRELAKVLNLDEQNTTPDFSGLTLREVYNRVRGASFHVQVSGRGLVASSSPAPGEPLPDSRTIKLFLESK